MEQINKLIAEMEAEIESRKLESSNLSGDYHAENWGHINALSETVNRLRAIVSGLAGSRT
jgi:hypothetical protein